MWMQKCKCVCINRCTWYAVWAKTYVHTGDKHLMPLITQRYVECVCVCMSSLKHRFLSCCSELLADQREDLKRAINKTQLHWRQPATPLACPTLKGKLCCWHKQSIQAIKNGFLLPWVVGVHTYRREHRPPSGLYSLSIHNVTGQYK